MAASYPGATLSWTSRINSQTIYAADPNTLAAEIDAIETYVGTNPHHEPHALTGGTKTFSNMSARLSSAMLQDQHPYYEIYRSTNQNISHSTASTHVQQNYFTTEKSSWSGYGISGGTVKIKDAGVWLIHATQKWNYTSSGWVQMQLLSGGSILDRDIFNYSLFPRSGSNSYGERFLNDDAYTHTSFLGRLGAGSVISVSSGNYTNSNPLAIQWMSMSMYFVRP